MTSMGMAGAYPINIEVDGPSSQSRLTVFFRYFMIIPHVIVLYALQLVVSVVSFLAWFAIMFTGSSPAGLQAFAVNVMHWNARVSGYLLLMTGAYPPFALGPDSAYPVRLSVEPQVSGRNRITVFFRYFMVIPHIFVLYVFILIAAVVYFVAWLVALFTGSVPAGMHSFLVGVMRYMSRVQGYQMLLVDTYPPFGTS